MRQGYKNLVYVSGLVASVSPVFAGGNFVDIAGVATANALQPSINVMACCDGRGSGAYCSDLPLAWDQFSASAPLIACPNAGVKLPANYYPTDCNWQGGRWCTFSQTPGQAATTMTIYQNVIARFISPAFTQNVRYGNQFQATGWPNYSGPTQWGFNGTTTDDFNMRGVNVSGPVAITVPANGCTAITNTTAVSGSVAFIDRGACEFGLKVLNAQNAGAKAVIIANNSGGDDIPFNMGAGSQGINTDLPAILISQNMGNTIRNLVNTGQPVTAQMGNVDDD